MGTRNTSRRQDRSSLLTLVNNGTIAVAWSAHRTPVAEKVRFIRKRR